MNNPMDDEPLRLSEDPDEQKNSLYAGWYCGPARAGKLPRNRLQLTRPGGEEISLSLKEARALMRHLFSVRTWIYAKLDHDVKPGSPPNSIGKSDIWR